MKNFSDSQLKQLKKEIHDCFLTKEKFKFYKEKFNFSYESFKKALIYNGIPFKSGDIKLALKSLKIDVVDKTIKYEDFLLIDKKYIKEFINSKIRISFKCIECGNEGNSRLSYFLNRIFLRKCLCVQNV
jgi:hypothetical protein